MTLVVLTFIMIGVGVIAYIIGALRLAKYGFRVGTLVGLAVLLFPPYTFYFAFKKLEVDGKEFPTALCFFGLVLTGILVGIFWQPLSLTATGNFDELEAVMTVEDAPGADSGDTAGDDGADEDDNGDGEDDNGDE